jgi:hypothetical protein
MRTALAPIPLAPPVIIATFPSSLKIKDVHRFRKSLKEGNSTILLFILFLGFYLYKIELLGILLPLILKSIFYPQMK